MKPSICFTICSLSNSGGTERVSTLIANELCRRGYNVYFIRYIGYDGTPFFPLDNRIKQFSILRNKMEHKLRHIPGYVQRRYLNFLRKNNIDIVIDVDIFMAEISAKVCFKANIKLVSWDHFNYMYMNDSKRKKNVLNLIKNYSSRLVVLTKADKQMYLANTSFKSEFICQIYNPTSFISPHLITHSENKVIALGRFTFQKGFDYLLKAWAIVETQIPNWTLEIIGDDGKDEAGIHKLKANLNLKRVKLLPATKDVIQKYHEASIYALSSRFEGFPMVLLEATTMGLPIVAFDCKTGPNEIIEDGVNGFLIEPGNFHQFAYKLIELIQEREKRINFGRNSYQISKKFTISNIINQWEDLFSELTTS